MITCDTSHSLGGLYGFLFVPLAVGKINLIIMIMIIMIMSIMIMIIMIMSIMIMIIMSIMIIVTMIIITIITMIIIIIVTMIIMMIRVGATKPGRARPAGGSAESSI